MNDWAEDRDERLVEAVRRICARSRVAVGFSFPEDVMSMLISEAEGDPSAARHERALVEAGELSSAIHPTIRRAYAVEHRAALIELEHEHQLRADSRRRTGFRLVRTRAAHA